jgi:tetratricopeptide (TPR) repeat protein
MGSDIQLYESDTAIADNTRVLSWLTAAYLRIRFREGAEICDRQLTRSNDCYSAALRDSLQSHGPLREAEEAYLRAVSNEGHGRPSVRTCAFLPVQGRWRDAREHFELSVEAEAVPARRALTRGQMLVELYPLDRDKLLEARARFEEALALQPSFGQAQQWLAIVNRALDTLPADQP